MTVSEPYQLSNTELKVVNPVIEPAMHAIPGQDIDTLATTKSLRDMADVFSITYYYQNYVHRSRVVKVGRTEAESFYKVVLNSRVCGNQCLCWLKKQPEGWQMLLGQPIDAELMTAITTAIESR